MIELMLYETQLFAMLMHIRDGHVPAYLDHNERRSLKHARLRLEAALDASKRQPLDAELDALSGVLYELRVGTLRDELMRRLAEVHYIAALWSGLEQLPPPENRELLRIELIDEPEWREQALSASLDYGIALALPSSMA